MLTNYYESNEQIFQDIANSKDLDQGIKSGIVNLDDIIRLNKKRFTILTSNENQGKTTFLNYYAFMMAQTHGYKTLFLSFENERICFYKKLKKVYNGNEFADFSRYMPIDDITSIDDIFNRFDFFMEKMKFDILIIDPMESFQMYMSNNYRSEDYANVLERIRLYTQRNNIITILAAHQKKLEPNEEPSINKIFGSVSFGNKADNVISIQQVRPLVTKVKALKIRHNFAEGQKGKSAHFAFNPINEHFAPIEEKEINDFDFGKFALTEKAKNDVMEIQKEVFKEVAGRQEMAQESTQPQQIDNTKAEQTKALENANKAFFHDTKVSVYDDFTYVQDITLWDALTMGKEHIEHINHCRELKARGEGWENEYKELKRQLPSFTASATYRGERKAENLTNYNALCVIDLDNLADVEKAKEDVSKLPFVLYCAKSVGGKGLYCIVRLDGDIDDYKAHWYALKDDFEGIGYKVDISCKDISRLRFVSYDENPYINYKATIYTKKKEIQIFTPSTHCHLLNGNETKGLTPQEQKILEDIITDVQTNHLQLSKNHADTLYVASVLSSIMGEDGRQYLHIIRKQRSGYDERKIDDVFDYVQANNTEHYTLGALRKKYKEAITRK